VSSVIAALACGTTSADTLIKHAQKLLANCGIQMSPSKVTRLVRTFKHRVEANGYPFEAFLINSVQLTAEQRRKPWLILRSPA
jgi:hypothetical protein